MRRTAYKVDKAWSTYIIREVYSYLFHHAPMNHGISDISPNPGTHTTAPETALGGVGQVAEGNLKLMPGSFLLRMNLTVIFPFANICSIRGTWLKLTWLLDTWRDRLCSIMTKINFKTTILPPSHWFSTDKNTEPFWLKTSQHEMHVENLERIHGEWKQKNKRTQYRVFSSKKLKEARKADVEVLHEAI